MIEQLEIENFKCFARQRVVLRKQNLLVGPNNAGKSTIVSAVRLAAHMVATASRVRPPGVHPIDGQMMRVYPVGDFMPPIKMENLRHEHHTEVTTSIRLVLTDGIALTCRWDPEADPRRGNFWLEVGGEGGQPIDTKRAREILDPHRIGVLPVLRPLDLNEEILAAKTVARNLTSPRASSHFRNQLYFSSWDEYARFGDLVEEYLPEISLYRPTRDGSGNELNVFYKERGRDRELSWAGDGMQIFLQVLLHLARMKDCGTVVLDEPEVFLHPDLQARLLEAVAASTKQFVISTHSTEIVSAVEPSDILIVDKDRKVAHRAKGDLHLDEVTASLGSAFQLRVARVLRTGRALFVEGEDLKILDPISHTLTGRSISTNPGIAVVPLNGANNWQRLVSFDWVADSLLKNTMTAIAVFDRDFHSEQALQELVRDLAKSRVSAHVWRRHELESYLIVPELIARLSGCPETRIVEMLEDLASCCALGRC